MFRKLKCEIDKLKTGGYQKNEFYRVYGRCQMAYEIGAISRAEFFVLNHEVVADGINNSKYFRDINFEKANTITTEMMEHICDNLCRHPAEAVGQEELEVICADCEMGKFICDILNSKDCIVMKK